MENDSNTTYLLPSSSTIPYFPKTPKSLRKPSDEHNCTIDDVEGSDSQISSCLILNFKFAKTVTTDANLIDFDSFRYVKK